MTSTELRERLTKAQEKLAKMELLPEKHLATSEKKIAKANKLGFESLEQAKAAKNYDAVWLFLDAEHAVEASEDAKDRVEEQKKVVANWQARLDRQLEIETKLIKEVPEAFKQAREELKARWIEMDIKQRDIMKQQRRELEWKEFRKLYTYTAEQALLHTDEEFEKIEERESLLWVIDLYNRVYNKTGKAVDCSRLFFNGKALNGTVVGENGTATVETIVAGGYNIQRLHYRVLVK